MFKAASVPTDLRTPSPATDVAKPATLAVTVPRVAALLLAARAARVAARSVTRYDRLFSLTDNHLLTF